MKSKKIVQLYINSKSTHLGDAWMRLIGFYSIAELYSVKITISIPDSLYQIASDCFGDRLTIVKDNTDEMKIIFTPLGVKEIIKYIFTDKRFIAPYHRILIKDKKKKGLKDAVNIMLFNLFSFTGLVGLPDWKYLDCYLAYIDIIGIKELRDLDYGAFCDQIRKDYSIIFERLSSYKKYNQSLSIPFNISEKLLIFPTGTAYQFVTSDWAKKNYPDAYYAFYYNDATQDDFKSKGLHTVLFYEPADILKLANSAKWVLTTDSFPSHLLQYGCDKCTLTITEAPITRVVSPAFNGPVVNAEAACHPCRHLMRKRYATCEAGYVECINWTNEKYMFNLKSKVFC